MDTDDRVNPTNQAQAFHSIVDIVFAWIEAEFVQDFLTNGDDYFITKLLFYALGIEDQVATEELVVGTNIALELNSMAGVREGF